jgi:hypothetical protein
MSWSFGPQANTIVGYGRKRKPAAMQLGPFDTLFCCVCVFVCMLSECNFLIELSFGFHV